jgi:Family of unknown function (DUF6603)
VADNTIDGALEKMGTALAPLEAIFTAPRALETGLNSLGYASPPNVDMAALQVPDVGPLIDALRAVTGATKAQRADFTIMAGLYADLALALEDVIADIAALADALPTAFAAAGDYVQRTNIDDELPRILLDALVMEAVGEATPKVYNALLLLGIFRRVEVAAQPANYVLQHVRARVEWEAIGTLFSNPRKLFVDTYHWGLADFDAELLLSNLGLLLQSFGAHVALRDMPRALEERLGGRAMPEAVADPSPQLILDFSGGVGESSYRLDLSIHRARASAPGAIDGGIELVPRFDGTAVATFPLVGILKLVLEAELDLEDAVALAVRPGAVTLRSGLTGPGAIGSASGRLGLGVRVVPPTGERPALLTFPGGSRLDADQIYLLGGAALALGGDPDPFIGAGVVGGRALITMAQADGFLAKLLPAEGIKAEFELGVTWSQKGGVHFEGSGALEIPIPIHQKLGPIALEVIRVRVGIAQQGLQLGIGITGGLALGPIAASVEDIGVRGDLSFQPGNLGPVGLALSFKPPRGAGLSIKAGPVGGGGYLFFDPDAEQYAGIMQLSFQAIKLTAIGLVTTRMPDGSKGFSMLIIITAEFPPIQLGYGFTLNGAGGLLGVNRTFKVDVLRAGIQQRTLGSILFPKDPIRNAPQIVSDLNAVFPPALGRFVFGPMIALGWGSPTLLKIEIGLVLELPSPVRLALMGRISLALPTEEEAVLSIHLDVLGVIDFDKGEASVDATIYDSRIAIFTITGDMAMRANWTGSPAFAMAIGGFNPRFQPPGTFPSLKRLAISLSTGDNPRLRLEAYLAVTSNTLQTGAHLDAYAAIDLGRIIGKFSVAAWMGFDVLLQFIPLSLIAEMGAGVALKHNDDVLFGVDLHLTLTGPAPWHAWGEASFDFFGHRAIPLDVTIGEAAPPVEELVADALAALVEAIKAVSAWTAQLPPSGDMLASFRPLPPADGIVAHPLGDLTLRQRVVPLNLTISKFGNATPSGARSFQLSASVNGTPASPAPQPVKDYFAPAQFFEMTDDEKLARPSFEPLESGIRFGAGGASHGVPVPAELGYESRTIDLRRQVVVHLAPYAIAQATIDSLAQVAAGGLATAGGSADRYAWSGPAIKVNAPRYTVAGTDDLVARDGPHESYTEALASDQASGADSQIVRDYESVTP